MKIDEQPTEVPMGVYEPMPSDSGTYAYTALQANLLAAEAVMADEGTQYALLLQNDRLDDEHQVAGAGREWANAQTFMDLFRTSFDQFRQGAAYQQLHQGKAVVWRPNLLDRYGRSMGGFPPVMLVPTIGATGHPLIQITLPRHNWVAQLSTDRPERQRPDGIYLERSATTQTQEWLQERLGDREGQQLLSRLLTPVVGYTPSLPSHFARALVDQLQRFPQVSVAELAERLPLERITRQGAGRLEGRQRIQEPSFRELTNPLHLNPNQEEALLLGHGLATKAGLLTYQPHTGRLDWSQPVVLRPLQPGDVELVTGQLLRQLRRANLTTQPLDVIAFGQAYANLFRPTRLYDPADPVQFYRRLATSTRQAISQTGPQHQQESALQHFLTEQYNRGEVMQVLTSPGQLRALLRGNGPLSLHRLDRHVGPTAQRLIQEATHLESSEALTQYKGVSLSPKQRTDLLAGKSVAVAGLRDPGRGSLYAATITLSALQTQYTAARPGQTEHLQTNSRQEAAAHTTLTGGASSATSMPTASDIQQLRAKPTKPAETTHKPRL